MLKNISSNTNWAWQRDDKHLNRLLSKLIAKDSVMRKFFDARSTVKLSITKSALETLEICDGTLTELGIELKLNVKPSIDLKVLKQAVEEKYTMIKHMEYSKWNWECSNEVVDDLANYINIIDVCNVKHNSKNGS
jgi:hypothetical protein